MVNAYPFGSEARGTRKPEAGRMTDKELFERISRSPVSAPAINSWFESWGWAVGGNGVCCWNSWID